MSLLQGLQTRSKRKNREKEVSLAFKQLNQRFVMFKNNNRIEGSRKPCGHYCGSHGNICCRCQTPAHGHHFLPYDFMCKICKGVLWKHPDGCYVQKCPECGRPVLTIDRGTPVCAPLARCGSCQRKYDYECVTCGFKINSTKRKDYIKHLREHGKKMVIIPTNTRQIKRSEI